MSTEPIDTTRQSILDELKGTRDALRVPRVFGDPHTIDGVTIIPVARLAGGGAGGGGGGTGPDDEGGRGFGTGFGLGAYPVGVYEIRDGAVCWKPTVDVSRLVHGSQVLAGIVTVWVSLVLMRRNRGVSR